MGIEAFYFGTGPRRQFGTFHAAVGEPRGGAVFCPPLLHEHARSYRFFSQVADRMAAAGIACLRFDYAGTGDADGVDAYFQPDEAPAQVVEAVRSLRARIGEAPIALLGIRASALFAAQALRESRADAFWCWQPVYDGARYVERLDAWYREELDSRDRFPASLGPADVGPDDLMGFRVSPELRPALSALCLAAPPVDVPMAILDGEAPAGPFADALHVPLPASCTAWAHEIDLRNLVSARDAEAAIAHLAASIPAAPRRVACG